MANSLNNIFKINMRKFFLLLCLSFFISNIIKSQNIVPGLKSIENKAIRKHSISKTLEGQCIITDIFDKNAIYGISISGRIKFKDKSGFIKVIISSKDSLEFLVFEGYSSYYDSIVFNFDDICEETCILDSIFPEKMIINAHNALLNLNEINIKSRKYSIEEEALNDKNKELKAQFEKSKVEKINDYNKKNGLLWIAGETKVSKLSYQNKKDLMGLNDNTCLYGFEYYISGIFEFPENNSLINNELIIDTLGFASSASNLMEVQSSSTYRKKFDWRYKHGANDLSSPYYDGDADGSGWLTSVKDQGSLGSCWMFAACGATEAMTNIYFNKHINLDLAEQEAVSCCSTCWGSPFWGLNYIKSSGVVQESCFPYTQSRTTPCTNKQCTTNLTQITGIVKYDNSTEDQLKKMIVESGPLSGTICPSGCHSMTLIGFGVVEQGDCIGIGTWDCDEIPSGHSAIGNTYWIFKNSYGSDWGENGYVRILISYSDITAYSATTPIINSNFSRRCVDFDGDGYYNWGIGDKPSACPDCRIGLDGDDSNPYLGPLDENGNCSLISPIIFSTTHVTQTQTWSDTKKICGDLLIRAGAVLTITGVTIMGYNSTITLQDNSQLKILGGKLYNANIIVKNGCKLLIDNNGIIELNGNDLINIESGATFDNNYGQVIVNN